MHYDEWRAEVTRLLDELERLDLGYPLGENVVRPPLPPSDSVRDRVGADCAKKLDAFFSVCDGVSWPDVHNGYFLIKKEALGRIVGEYDPIEVTGSIGGPVVVVGSSGSGALFAIRATVGDVVVLPVGRIEKNTYYDVEGNVRIIASDFDGFLRLLLEDLRAFVSNTQGHSYIL